MDTYHRHNKYWEIELRGGMVMYRWGRRGSEPDFQYDGHGKSESATDKALLTAERALQKKLREGYRHVSAAGDASVGQQLQPQPQPQPQPLPLNQAQALTLTLILTLTLTRWGSSSPPRSVRRSTTCAQAPTAG